MITLPVSSSVYQSMVANIQQIHTNGDGTLCITPMQVQKPGHQHSISHLNSTNLSGNLIGSNCSAPCISSVNSSYSNGGAAICNANTSPFSSEISSTINCDTNNGNNNLLELCRVLSQSTSVSNCASTMSFGLPQSIDKKAAKSKKLNRNQFFATSNFESSTSFAEANGSFLTQNLSEHKSMHESDSNNNNHNEESSGSINHDLKCAQILAAADESPSKSDNIAGQLHETENRIIKMECEIDAA